MRLEKPRISVTFIAIIDLIFVKLIRLHIYAELVESITNSTASFRSGDRYEISNTLEFDDVIGDWREYRITLSVL